MDIVQILSTGVSGFAFLMLLVGYKLTSQIQNKILDIQLAEIEVEKLSLWSDLANKPGREHALLHGFLKPCS